MDCRLAAFGDPILDRFGRALITCRHSRRDWALPTSATRTSIDQVGCRGAPTLDAFHVQGTLGLAGIREWT